MKTKPYRFLALAVLMASASAQAALIAYDGFSYTAGGTIDAENGGTGWAGAWTAAGTTSTSNFTSSVPLTYSGGTVNITGDTRTALLANNSSEAYVREFAPQTGDLYFSFLYRFQTAGTADVIDNDDFTHFMLNNDATNANSGGIGTLSTTTKRLGARIGTTNGGDTTSSSTDMVADTTYFLVGKISKESTSGNYDTVKLYINPTSTTEPMTADATDFASTGSSTFSYFTVRGFNLEAGDQYLFDELRIGTDFASVVIPEPSAFLLTSFSACLLLRRRRS